MAKALILCPTFDHADTLFASIASVRAQKFTEWEMVVIGDGAPERTFEISDAIIRDDPRVRYERHPKSVRYGELYRDPVIRSSDAEFVLHLGDDDIWTPDHLGIMIAMLERAEWAVEAPLRILTNAAPQWWPINHGTPQIRAAVAELVGVSAGINYVGYRRDAYLRLPEGWTCAPWGTTSDVYMWAKFMRDPALSIASSAVTSVLKFPSGWGDRADFSPENRMAEITPWLARAAEPGLADRMRRVGDIRDRMIMLFAVHEVGDYGSADEALEKSGLKAVPAHCRPVATIGADPMILPLTDQQRDMAADAWVLARAFERAFNGQEACDNQSRQILERELSQSVNTAYVYAHSAPLEKAMRAFATIQATYPGHPDGYIRPALRLFNVGKFDEAAAHINALEAVTPNHPMATKIAADIDQARSKR